MLKLLLPLFLAFSNLESNDTTCPQPANVHVTARSSGSISFDWDDCGCVFNNYKVKYTRLADSYTSPDYTAGSSDYSHSNLQAGDYLFYFWTDCESEDSEAIVIEDLISN